MCLDVHRRCCESKEDHFEFTFVYSLIEHDQFTFCFSFSILSQVTSFELKSARLNEWMDEWIPGLTKWKAMTIQRRRTRLEDERKKTTKKEKRESHSKAAEIKQTKKKRKKKSNSTHIDWSVYTYTYWRYVCVDNVEMANRCSQHDCLSSLFNTPFDWNPSEYERTICKRLEIVCS